MRVFSEPTRDSHKEDCIVYGLHCSRDKLRIVAHFPMNVEGDAAKNWKFAQVMVAEHWIGLARARPLFPHFDDNALLHRWRLSGALFFIRKHVMGLRELLGYTPNVPNTTQWVVNSLSLPLGNSLIYDRDTLLDLSGDKHPSILTLSSPHSGEVQTLRHLCRYWRSSHICVPESWIVSL